MDSIFLHYVFTIQYLGVFVVELCVWAEGTGGCKKKKKNSPNTDSMRHSVATQCLNATHVLFVFLLSSCFFHVAVCGL